MATAWLLGTLSLSGVVRDQDQRTLHGFGGSRSRRTYEDQEPYVAEAAHEAAMELDLYQSQFVVALLKNKRRRMNEPATAIATS